MSSLIRRLVHDIIIVGRVQRFSGFAREQSLKMMLFAIMLGLAAAEQLNPITRVAQLLEGLAKKVRPSTVVWSNLCMDGSF